MAWRGSFSRSLISTASASAFPENPSKQSLIPSFLYSSSLKSKSLVTLEQRSVTGVENSSGQLVSPAAPPSAAGRVRSFLNPSPNESRVQMYSPAYYAACTARGIFSCGLTHMSVTPLYLVKYNMQIDPAKYKI